MFNQILLSKEYFRHKNILARAGFHIALKAQKSMLRDILQPHDKAIRLGSSLTGKAAPYIYPSTRMHPA